MSSRVLVIGWLVAVSAAAAYLWLTGGWFHIELLPVSDHVRERGLLTVFDWSVFDSNPNRLRPLSDLIEVVDAMMRPRTVWLFGHHASLSLSALVIAISCPALFYRALREMGLSRNEALAGTALFISTIAYLSCFVPYIRPAKRLALLGLCAVLYLVFRFIRSGSDRDLAWLYAVLLLSFFADEAGFVNWPIALLILGSRLRGARLAGYFMIPVVYLLLAKGLLPPIYDLLGKSGPRDEVIATSMVAKLLGSLLSLDFYALAIENLGRTVAASFGTLSVPDLIPIVAVLAIGSYALVRRVWVVSAVSFLIVGISIFFSMIDQINTTKNHIGQWTYYYHTPVAVLALLWVAAVYHWLRPTSTGLRIAAGLTIAVISMLNLNNFQRVNEIVKIIHTYPLARLIPRTFDPQGLGERFEVLLKSGSLPEADAFRRQFSYYRVHPMGDSSYAERLEQTYKKTRSLVK